MGDVILEIIILLLFIGIPAGTFSMFAFVFFKIHQEKKEKEALKTKDGEKTADEMNAEIGKLDFKRIEQVYEIRQNDSDFDTNLVEEDIKEHIAERLGIKNICFKNLKILNYEKNDDTAELTYEVKFALIGYAKSDFTYIVHLVLKTMSSDEIMDSTISCSHCSAPIENPRHKACPYCGHTYEFMKYGKWQITGMEEK